MLGIMLDARHTKMNNMYSCTTGVLVPELHIDTNIHGSSSPLIGLVYL